MKVILAEQCESLTGMLDSGTGYYLRRKGKGFFSQRSRYHVPEDGHWRFILQCAHLAQNPLYIADIAIHWSELQTALWEAYHFVAADQVGVNGREAKKLTYNARDILNLQITFGL